MIQDSAWENSGGIRISRPTLKGGPEGRIFQRGLNGLNSARSRVPRQLTIRLILVISLVAFEIFNFDTSRFALTNLLGEASFMGLKWATILAIAFCSIDFAGLAYVFSPERERSQSQEVWYLMGAWLLGATMNALMTWWAVSLTLLDHDLGNEVVDRQRLLQIVPFFVAALVWLTRILFIGAFSVAGGRLMLPFGGRVGDSADQPVERRVATAVDDSDLPRATEGVRVVAGQDAGMVAAGSFAGAGTSSQGRSADDSGRRRKRQSQRPRSGGPTQGWA